MSVGSVVVVAAIAVIAVFAGRHAWRTFVGKDSCCGGGGSGDLARKKVKKVKVEDTNAENYQYRQVFAIGDMSCDGCRANVENAINALPGTWARVDLVSRTAEVLSKTPIDEEAVEKAVTDAGYRVIHL